MAATLQMTWVLDDGKAYTKSLMNPKSDLTEANVRPVMEMAVTKDMIRHNGNKLASVKEAVIRKVEEQELF